jgi:hypothetical protein
MRVSAVLASSIVAIGLVGTAAANAAVVLSDTFTGCGAACTPNTLNWPGDGVFTSDSGPATGPTPNNASVDLVGPSNPFGITSVSPSLNVVDMDGTTGSGNVPSGILQSNASLSTGDYTVTFWLSGNQRGAPPVSLSVTIGSETQTFGPLASSAPWTFETLHFTGVSGPLFFIGSGPSDQQGDLIGDVSVLTGIPEASTCMMTGLGFAGLGFAAFRKGRKKDVAIA